MYAARSQDSGYSLEVVSDWKRDMVGLLFGFWSGWWLYLYSVFENLSKYTLW